MIANKTREYYALQVIYGIGFVTYPIY